MGLNELYYCINSTNAEWIINHSYQFSLVIALKQCYSQEGLKFSKCCSVDL